MANSDFARSPYARWLVGAVRSGVRFVRLSAPEICTLFVPLGESPDRAAEVFDRAWLWLESEVRRGRLHTQIGQMVAVEICDDLATLRALEAGECGIDLPPPVPACAVWTVPLWNMGPSQLPAHRIEFSRGRVEAAVRHASCGLPVGERAPLRDWLELSQNVDSSIVNTNSLDPTTKAVAEFERLLRERVANGGRRSARKLAEWAVKAYRDHRNSNCGVDSEEWKSSAIRLIQRDEFAEKPVTEDTVKRYWRDAFNAGSSLTIQGG